MSRARYTAWAKRFDRLAKWCRKKSKEGIVKRGPRKAKVQKESTNG